MSSIEEVSDDNRWVVYLKSDTESDNKTEQIEDKEREDEECENEEQGEDLTELNTSDNEEKDSDTPRPGRSATVDGLPEKSKEKYEMVYNNFVTWMSVKGGKTISQETILEYFKELSKVKKPPTLWCVYSMLKSTIYTHDKIDIRSYKKIFTFLKQFSVGYKVKQIKPLTSSEIDRFLKEAPDQVYLATKVIAIFAIVGVVKRTEYCNITTDDIDDIGSMVKIKIPNATGREPRIFSITGKFYDIFKKYASLRPKNVPTNRFFLNYHKGKCTQQVIGINKFGSTPKQIARFLNLPEPNAYNIHSFRQASGKLLSDWGASETQVTCHCRWKLPQEPEHCTEDVAKVKRKIREKVTEPVAVDPSPLREQSATETPPPKRRKSDDSPDVDPLKTSSDKPTIRIESVTSVAESFVKMPNVMQLNPESNLTGKPLKLITRPAVQTQLSKSAPAPSSQQRNQLQRVVIKAIPLNVKETRQTVKLLPKQQTGQSNPPITPQKPANVSLKWNNHHSNMQTSFPSFLDSEEFVDVTLACEGKSVKCHKVILSSCSTYLAALLRENPCQHPIILMKDLRFWQVEALVTFMYRGQVSISQDQLTELLDAAEALQVKGLAGSSQPRIQKPSMPIPQEKTQSPTATGPKLPTLVRQEKTEVPPVAVSKRTEVKRPKSSTDAPTKIRLITVPNLEHFPQLKRFRPRTKTHHQSTKIPSTPSSPPALSDPPAEIKSEPLDIPQSSTTDMFPGNNNGDSTTGYGNLMTMHKIDDSGNEERLDSMDDDILFEFEAISDMSDPKKEIEFIPMDFSEQEQSILREVDDDGTEDSLLDVQNTSTKLEKLDSNSECNDEKKWTKEDKR